MIANLEFDNFTAFEKLDLSLSPRINVIIGSNGTGKTHLLKAIYALGLIVDGKYPERSETGFAATTSGKFLRIFSTEGDRVGMLASKSARAPANLRLVHSDDSSIKVTFNGRSQYLEFASRNAASKPVYIPTKEVLSLVRGIRHSDHDRATVEMIFDDSYLNLAELLVQPVFDEKRSDSREDPRLSNVIRKLVDLVGGRYCLQNDGGFNFEPGRYEEVEKPKTDPSRSDSQTARAYQDSKLTRFRSEDDQAFPTAMTAEGYRKIGVLHRLLSNGSINPGETGVLLWDEPEANLNPRLMKELVQVLLELSRNGQQIILATHDYVLLKWLDLLMDKTGKEDHVRFHVLQRNDGDKAISIYSTDEYEQLVTTGISKTFGELYEAEIERSLKGIEL
ncbi:ATP-binding protein [Shimia thalassica]|uniref:AAA family ATPase n=1 Tax=Shimia thalassica TaxID=1715693 RepID=UPI002732A9B1|nr:ATP-binding protein [Shimia thalassica]MDP2578416.1 ATP-binding protein [Shimia thalassica]